MRKQHRFAMESSNNGRKRVAYTDVVMSAQRVWLDWNQPCLPATAEWLINANLNTGLDVCDLRRVVCVLPGSRAGRVLLAQLIEQCEASTLRLIPPRVLTPGAMFEALLEIDQPMATDLESMLTWIAALQAVDPDQIKPLLPRIPATSDLLAWQSLALEIHRLHVELAGAQLDFSAVADCAERMEMFSEGERWRALQTVADRYFSLLKRHALADTQRARQMCLREVALENGDQQQCPRLVLIAVTDLNAMQRALVHVFDDRVCALIHAPQSMCDRFDALGCVNPTAWADDVIVIHNQQIRVADRPDDQAQHALQAMASYDGRFGPEQITIGLGDEQLAPVIIRHGEWADLGIRSAAGRSLSQSAPVRFLEAAGDYLREHRFANLAALIRHPDVEAWLLRQCQTSAEDTTAAVQDWLSLLDRYFSDHLHDRLSGAWLGDDHTRARLKTVHDAITRLLSPLATSRNQLLDHWAPPILQVLNELYRDIPSHLRNATLPACEMLRDLLANFTSIIPALQPKIDAPTAIQMLLQLAADVAIPVELQPQHIEMLGWLELHLDLAPALIITGCNDGQIPRTTGADPFLPDSLRSALKLADNNTRYARDAYLLQAILRSRPSITLITGRRSADGDSLSPSRLLLACEPDVLVNRITTMCGEVSDRAASLPIGLQRHQQQPCSSRFVIPDLGDAPPLRDHMSVTEFRTYIECPYRYALGKLLRLESSSDEAMELDPLQFGNLTHDVLCEFGGDLALADSADADHIERGLITILHRHQKRFGSDPLPAVQVQMARLGQRLRSFAEFQARHRAAGWRIRHCELQFKGRIELEIPGQQPMPLSGRIDRVDFNEQTSEWLIADYKTGDTANSPFKTHHEVEKISDGGKLEWFDLQLPLYRHLAARVVTDMPNDAVIHVGYICLPKHGDETDFVPAEWTDAHIESAIDKAREVVRDIRAGKFDINPDFDSDLDAFARICQTQVFADDDALPADDAEGQ